MYKANLSGEQNNYYLQELLENQLISQDRADDGSFVYRTTQRGRECLGHYYRMIEFVEGRREHILVTAATDKDLVFPSM
jgi:predicted transcriptional regulator